MKKGQQNKIKFCSNFKKFCSTFLKVEKVEKVEKNEILLFIF